MNFRLGSRSACLVALSLLACDGSDSDPGSAAAGGNSDGTGAAPSDSGGIGTGKGGSVSSGTGGSAGAAGSVARAGGGPGGVGGTSKGGTAGLGTGGDAGTAGSASSGDGGVGGTGGRAGGTSGTGGNAGMGSGGSEAQCSNPVFMTSDPNGGWSNGGYYVHNNMWNREEAGPETLYACAYDNWYVDSRQPNTTSVKTYPNVHLDINNLNGAPLADYATITSTFAGAGPRVGIYNFAYDIWLDGVGWGGGTTEFMIWTENFNQRPLGSSQTNVTFDGLTFDAWHYSEGDANVITLVARSTIPSGTFDLREMLDWAIARGWMPSNPTINQIGFGVEICSTNDTTQRFTFTDFSVTMN